MFNGKYGRFAYFEPLKCHEYFIYCENLSVKTYSKLFTMAKATRKIIMNYDIIYVYTNDIMFHEQKCIWMELEWIIFYRIICIPYTDSKKRNQIVFQEWRQLTWIWFYSWGELVVDKSFIDHNNPAYQSEFWSDLSRFEQTVMIWKSRAISKFQLIQINEEYHNSWTHLKLNFISRERERSVMWLSNFWRHFIDCQLETWKRYHDSQDGYTKHSRGRQWIHEIVISLKINSNNRY